MNQLTLDLGLEPIITPTGLACCPYCVERHRMNASLTWHPPDYKRGTCVYCKREFHVQEKYGGCFPAKTKRRRDR